MRTNIEIDDVLMREAQKVCGHATKKQTVEQALVPIPSVASSRSRWRRPRRRRFFLLFAEGVAQRPLTATLPPKICSYCLVTAGEQPRIKVSGKDKIRFGRYLDIMAQTPQAFTNY
jgi:hypothetical protein